MRRTPAGQRLLLVEDDRATSRAMRSLLTRRGWSVVVAGSIADALPYLEPAPSWVVLDLMLPDGNGASVLRKIRDEGIPSRVAVTTGSIDRNAHKLVHSLQPELFLTKPIDIDLLVRRLGEFGSAEQND